MWGDLFNSGVHFYVDGTEVAIDKVSKYSMSLNKLHGVSENVGKSINNLANATAFYMMGQTMTNLGNSMLAPIKYAGKMAATFETAETSLKMMLQKQGRSGEFDAISNKILDISAKTTMMTEEVLTASAMIGNMAKNMTMPFTEFETKLGGTKKTLLEVYADFIAYRQVMGDYRASTTALLILQRTASGNMEQMNRLLDDLYNPDIVKAVKAAKTVEERMRIMYGYLAQEVGGYNEYFMNTWEGTFKVLKDQTNIFLTKYIGRPLLEVLRPYFVELRKFLMDFITNEGGKYDEYINGLKLGMREVGLYLKDMANHAKNFAIYIYNIVKENPSLVSSFMKFATIGGIFSVIGGKLLSLTGTFAFFINQILSMKGTGTILGMLLTSLRAISVWGVGFIAAGLVIYRLWDSVGVRLLAFFKGMWLPIYLVGKGAFYVVDAILAVVDSILNYLSPATEASIKLWEFFGVVVLGFIIGYCLPVYIIKVKAAAIATAIWKAMINPTQLIAGFVAAIAGVAALDFVMNKFIDKTEEKMPKLGDATNRYSDKLKSMAKEADNAFNSLLKFGEQEVSANVTTNKRINIEREREYSSLPVSPSGVALRKGNESFEFNKLKSDSASTHIVNNNRNIFNINTNTNAEVKETIKVLTSRNYGGNGIAR